MGVKPEATIAPAGDLAHVEEGGGRTGRRRLPSQAGGTGRRRVVEDLRSDDVPRCTVCARRK